MLSTIWAESTTCIRAQKQPIPQPTMPQQRPLWLPEPRYKDSIILCCHHGHRRHNEGGCGPAGTLQHRLPHVSWGGPRTLYKGPTAVYIGSVSSTGLWCVGCEHYQGVRSDGHGVDNTAHTNAAPTFPPSLAGLAEALAVVTCTLLDGMSVRK